MIKKSRQIFLFAVCSLCGVSAAYPSGHSGKLPVIYINTEGGQPIVSKEQGYVNASYWLESNGAEIESLGSEDAPLPLEIKARGNYTWKGFDKKPYKLKLGSKTELAGMDKNKHFALLAHADDQTGFSRNIAGLELSRRLGLDWTPADRPVELYLNGDYKGMYFLTQTIRIDKTRVNITEQADLSSEGVDGGWLVEIDNYDTDPHITVTEHGGNYPIWFTYKSPEVLSPEQEAWLTSQMNLINDAIYSEDKSSTEWEQLIDIESAVRYYIVQELVDDTESYHGSCYLYRDKGEDAKWHFGPVWDFGNAFIRAGGNKSRFIWDSPAFHQVWIGELCKFPSFQGKVREIWREFCENGYDGLEEYMLDYADVMTPAQDANFARWPQYGNSDIRSQIENTVKILRHNVKWLGEQWGYIPQEPLSVCLRGDFNNWGADLTMRYTSEGVYEISLSEIAGRNYSFSEGARFKLATEDWTTVDLGAPQKMMTPEVGTPFPLQYRGENIIVPAGLGSNHKLVLDLNDNTLTITNPSGVEAVEAGTDEVPEIYTVTGRRVTDMTARGVYILRYSTRCVKIVK